MGHYFKVFIEFTVLLTLLLEYCFCFVFVFFGHEAHGILASGPGIEPASPALEDEILTTRPPGKSHILPL